MPTSFRGVPGVYTGKSITPRNIFVQTSREQVQFAPTFFTIDGSKSRDTGSSPVSLLRAGLILGKITSGGKYRPSIIGLTSGAYTSGGTSLTVPAVVATEVARLIALAGASISLKIIGPPSAAGTVASISTTCSAASGTTLTITNLGANMASGSIVAPADGAETPLTVLSEEYGVDVTDEDGTSLDQPLPNFLRAADLISSQVINLTGGDASVQAWIKARLKEAGFFTFDNDRK